MNLSSHLRDNQRHVSHQPRRHHSQKNNSNTNHLQPILPLCLRPILQEINLHMHHTVQQSLWDNQDSQWDRLHSQRDNLQHHRMVLPKLLHQSLKENSSYINLLQLTPLFQNHTLQCNHGNKLDLPLVLPLPIWIVSQNRLLLLLLQSISTLVQDRLLWLRYLHLSLSITSILNTSMILTILSSI